MPTAVLWRISDMQPLRRLKPELESRNPLKLIPILGALILISLVSAVLMIKMIVVMMMIIPGALILIGQLYLMVIKMMVVMMIPIPSLVSVSLTIKKITTKTTMMT